jgi:glycosyltransferase involved in cell wall biosynthesis
LIDLVVSLKIQNRVIFKGKITSNKDLIEFYRNAFVSVSFGQAGLSVLQSLGYGVPFITKKNAISGGEITNIIDKYNGFLCEDSVESLKEKILLIIKNFFIKL